MAGSIGDLIWQMAGKEDPRTALMASVAGGGTSGTPGPAGDTSGAAGMGGDDPATAGTSTAPTPESLKSTPDMVDLYTQLAEKDQFNHSINTGIGLILSSMAYDENKASIQDAFGVGGGSGSDTLSGGGGSDSLDFMSKMMKIRGDQAALSRQAAHRAALPSIAKQYGLDLATAQYLFDTGKLDAIIQEAEKPNKEIVKGADDRSYIVDKTDGSISAPLGPEKKREIILEDDPISGGKIALYKDDMSPVGKGDIAGSGNTPDEKLYNASKRDYLTRNPGKKDADFPDMETWLREQANLKAPKTTVNAGDQSGALEKELAKTGAERYDTEYDAAKGARANLDYVSTARSKLDKGIIAGSVLSPLELEGRKVWADIWGIPDEAAANTEAFQASLKEAVLSKIKALGSGTAISDADRTFVERAVAGDIQLTENSMRQIFDIIEKGSIKQIENYNKEVDELINSYPNPEDREKVGRLLRKVDLPENPRNGVGVDEGVDDLVKKYLKPKKG